MQEFYETPSQNIEQGSTKLPDLVVKDVNDNLVYFFGHDLDLVSTALSLIEKMKGKPLNELDNFLK